MVLAATPASAPSGVAALPAELRRALVQLARTPRLLVACDYDGTLSPIVADPEQARPLPESVNALRSLASLSSTTVAVISGRALRDLATLSRLPSEVHLVGSHGSEVRAPGTVSRSPRARPWSSWPLCAPTRARP